MRADETFLSNEFRNANGLSGADGLEGKDKLAALLSGLLGTDFLTRRQALDGELLPVFQLASLVANGGHAFNGGDGPTFLPADGQSGGESPAVESGSSLEPTAEATQVTITTDKDDYAPGETAIITVDGVEAGASVTLEVDHVADRGEDGVLGTDDDVTVDLGGTGHDPFDVTDGGAGDLDGEANGSVSAAWHVSGDDSAGAEFRVTASDAESGAPLASAGFTDATSFTEKVLVRDDGEPISAISHMEFGPDGLLYASSLFGTIYAFDVNQDSTGEYIATLVHEIDLLSGVPNFNDDGAPAFADGQPVEGRFVIGFDVVGTANDPIIYVTHSDPRVDTHADSNSGVISQFQMDASGDWAKIDLVRALPRSQHDHLLNDVEYIDDGTGSPYLLVSSGGNTNAGAPSSPLRFLPEYVLSGAILKIDLDAITSMELKTDVFGQEYYFNQPTLDDPMRSGINEGQDESIEYIGGNGGLNQAIYDPDGPVTFYAYGLRNATEILQTESGALLTFDNGGNPSWGNTVVLGTDGQGNQIATNLPEDGGSITTNQDQLHLILEGAYFGHPNPFRASGSDAGLYEQDGSGTPLSQLPSDFDSLIPESELDFQQAFFLAEGTEDGAIALSSKSTNGLAEYSFEGAFDGALVGNIFAVRYGTNSLIRIELTDADGDGLPESGVKVEEYALGTVGPLDVLAPREGDPFHGVLFVSGLSGSGDILILEPGDGSAGVDLTDRDGDNIADVVDPFAYDPDNGQNTVLTEGATLFWDFESTTPAEDLPGGVKGFSVGISGFMTNGSDLPEALSLDRFDPEILGGDDVVLGGTANTILIGATPDGTAEGSPNTQYHGFQGGFVPQSEAFTLTVEAWNPFRSIAPGDQSEEQRVGAGLSTGDQDNFLALFIGEDYIELVHEVGGVEAARIRQTNPSINNVDTNVYLTDLSFDVDTVTGRVVASYEANTLDGLVTGSFEPIQLYGDLLDAIQGEYRIAGKLVAPAWTLMSTAGNAEGFESNWGSVTLEGTSRNAGTGELDFFVDAPTTFNANAFTIQNTGGVDITQLIITIDDTFVDETFWDSDGAGDGGGKAFTVDDAGGSGVTNAHGVTSNPLPGANFYQTLTIDFPDFNPGETVKFSIDADPTSSAGLPGGSEMGDISGLEITGSLITVVFADGTSASGELFGTSITASHAVVNGDLADQIVMNLNGLTNGQRGFVPTEQQVLEVNGEPNGRVAVLIGHADTVPDDAFGESIFVHPLDFNSIEGIEIKYVDLDGTGFGTTTVDVIDPDPNDPNDGIVRIFAAAVESNDEIIGRVGAGITARVGVDPGNFDPVAANDSVGTESDQSASDNVLDNDFDADGDELSVIEVNGNSGDVGSTVTLSSGAQLTLASDGGYVYDPNSAFDFLNPGEEANDLFVYTISDGKGGIDTATVNVTVTGVAVKGALVTAINANGSQYASVDTNVLYQADPGVSSGLITPRNIAPTEITGTQDDPLYQRYIFGTSFSYDFPIPNGEYVVELNLMEPWATAPGVRVFDVLTEGTANGAFDDIDINTLTNGTMFEGVTISTVAEVTDGVLDLDFIASANNAIVSGIAIYELANPSTGNGAPHSVSLNGDTVSEEATAGTVIGNLSATDPDDDPVTFSVNDSRFAVSGNQLVVASGADLTVNSDTIVPIIITASDGNGGNTNFNTSVTILDNTPPPTGGPVAAYNVAGGQFNSAEYQINFAADPGSISGAGVTRNITATISGTTDDALFQTYRFGTFSYDVALANGDYLVEFYLVEPWANSPDVRIFDIELEGFAVGATDDIDIFGQAGHDAALIVTAQVTVNDGVLDLDFLPSANNAIVSAFAIYQAGDPPENGDPENVALTGNTVSEEATAGTGIGTLSATDPDDDPVTFSVDDARFAVNGNQLVVAPGADLTVDSDTVVPIVITASDGNGGTTNLNTSVTILDNSPPPTGAPVAAFNVAGGQFNSSEFQIDFAADPGSVGGVGVTRNISAEISGTSDDALFQTYRYGSFSYEVALANGDYEVEFYLVEPWTTTAGVRVFDIQLEGSVPSSVDDIDIFATVGHDTIMLVSAPVTVSDGVLNLDFVPSENNAIVSAFAIYDAGEAEAATVADTFDFTDPDTLI